MIHEILDIYQSFNTSEFDKLEQCETMWEQYLKEPTHITDKTLILNKITNIQKHLANISVKMIQTHRAYKAYCLLTSICSHVYYKEIKLTPEENEMVANLKNQLYFCLSEKQREILYNKSFKKIFDDLKIYCEKLGEKYSHPPVTVRKDYVTGANMLTNQKFYPCFTDETLESISNAFAESRLDLILKKYYSSNFCVFNVRAWEYSYNKKFKVGAHYDGKNDGTGLPQKVTKIMFFEGDITPNHGCFEALAHGSKHNVIFQVLGHNPAILVNSIACYHRANAPKRGYIRRNIELTIYPYLMPEEKVFVDGGLCSGMPFNPFAHDLWQTRLYDPQTLIDA